MMIVCNALGSETYSILRCKHPVRRRSAIDSSITLLTYSERTLKAHDGPIVEGHISLKRSPVAREVLHYVSYNKALMLVL